MGLSGLAGCSPVQLAKRTLHYELNQFPRLTDGKISCRQYKRWAQEEWELAVAESPGAALSPDYESGFLQGFVDHVFAGGRVVPPAMPPRRYWRLPYRNEQGQEAIRQWYAGFEHGARVAQDKGYRELAVIPSSLFSGPMIAQEAGMEIDLDHGMDLEEPTPALPIDPDAALEELRVPSEADNAAADFPAYSPGGLPLPATDQAVPAPRGATADGPTPSIQLATHQQVEPTVTEELHEEPNEQTDAPTTSTDDLTLEPETEGPPVPPWRQPTTGQVGGEPATVVLAAAEQPIHGATPTVLAGHAADEAEFNPFAGTRFAEFSREASRPPAADARRFEHGIHPDTEPTRVTDGNRQRIATSEWFGHWT